MLQFNPKFRSRASELLKNPVFDKIRDATQEQGAPREVSLEIDGPGVFDYEALKCTKYNKYEMLIILENEVKIIKSSAHLHSLNSSQSLSSDSFEKTA